MAPTLESTNRIGQDTRLASGLAARFGLGRHELATDSRIRGGNKADMSGRFDIVPTRIAGLRVLQRKPISDSRGYLERMFCVEELQTVILGKHISQINHT